MYRSCFPLILYNSSPNAVMSLILVVLLTSNSMIACIVIRRLNHIQVSSILFKTSCSASKQTKNVNVCT